MHVDAPHLCCTQLQCNWLDCGHIQRSRYSSSSTSREGMVSDWLIKLSSSRYCNHCKLYVPLKNICQLWSIERMEGWNVWNSHHHLATMELCWRKLKGWRWIKSNYLSVHIIEIVRVYITIIRIIVIFYLIRDNDIPKIVKGEFRLISCIGLFGMIWTEWWIIVILFSQTLWSQRFLTVGICMTNGKIPIKPHHHVSVNNTALWKISGMALYLRLIFTHQFT